MILAKNTASYIAVLLALGVVLAALAFYPRSGLEAEAPLSPAESTVVGQTVPQHPTINIEAIKARPEENRPRDFAAAPCGGCLEEQAVRDVAEAYLVIIDPNYLNGGLRTQLCADEIQRPLAPPEFVGMPPGYSVADFISPLPQVEKDHTWIVWFQIGWYPRAALEQSVELGRLPLVALSWPPLARHSYIYVNARTGAVWPRGLFPDVLPIEHGRATELAKEAAKRRAAHWLTPDGDADAM